MTECLRAHVPTEVGRTTAPGVDDQAEVAAMVGEAVDDGRLSLEEAGYWLLVTYRARSRADLDRLVRDLSPDRSGAGPADRAFSLQAIVCVVLFALTAAILVLAVLDGLNPLDPH